MKPVRSCPVAWYRTLLATLIVAVGFAVAGGVVVASPAVAQDDVEPAPSGVTIDDLGDDAQPESSVVRDEDTSATVRRIRRDLIVIAGFTSLALLVYVWHTNPARRVRIASARAAAAPGSVDGDAESPTR